MWLAEIGNGLLPALVLAVDARGDLAEEDQVVLLEAASQLNSIVVVIVLNGVAESLVIFLLNKQIIDSLVHNTLVLNLDIEQERLDQGEIIVLLEDLDDTVNIDTGSEGSQEVGQQRRMLLDVKLDGTVVDFEIGNLDNDLLELGVIPGVLGAFNDGQSGVIKLIIVIVAENELGPKVCLLAGTDHLGHVHSGPEQLNVLHQTLRVILGQCDTKLSEHTHLLCIDDQIETTDLSQAELLLADASIVNLLPNPDVVSLASAFNSGLVFGKVDESGGKLGPVGDAGVEDLGSFIKSLLVSLVTRFLNVSNVCSSEEVLELMELVQTGIAESEGSIDGSLPQGLAGHAKELDEFLVLASVGSDFNDLLVILGVLGLDVRLNGVRDTKSIELSLGNLAPNFRQVDLLGICLCSINADDVLNENIDGRRLVVGLLVDLKGFLMESHFNTGCSNVISVVVVELVDVVHDASLVSLGSREEEEILEILVVAEWRGLQNNLLQQLNKFKRKIVLKEGRDGDRYLGWVTSLWNGGSGDLVDNRTTVNVVLAQDESPQLAVRALKEVTCLSPVHGILIGDIYQLQVILALGVGNVCQVGVTLLAVLSDGEGIVLVILLEELLWVVVRVNVDFGQSVENGLLCVASLQGGLKEGQEKLQPLINVDLLSINSAQKLLDDVLIAVNVQQSTDNGRGPAGIDALNLLRKLSFLEEVLHLLGIVRVTIAANTLNLIELAHLGSRFNILEVNIRVLRKVDDASQVVEETLSCLVLLEQINQVNRAKKLRVLGRNVNNRLQVLTDVVLHHSVKAGKRLLNGQLAKETFGGSRNVDNNTLDSLGVFVKFGGLLCQASLLAKVGNAGLVEVGEHVVGENSLSDLRSVHQVHLQKSGLQTSMFRIVILEGVKQEGGGLLDHTLRLENIANSLQVDQRTPFVVSQGSGKCSSLLWVCSNDVLEKLDKIGLIATLSTVGKNLIELPSLSEASNDLVGNVGLEIDCKSHVHIIWSNHITELLRAIQLLLLEPLLKQVLAVLGQNRLGKLDRLVRIQSTLVEKHTEVLQGESHLSRLSLELLELLNSLGGSEETARRVCCNLGGFAVVTSVEELVELSGVEVVGAGKASTRCHLDGDFAVGRILKEIGDRIRVINSNKQDLTLTVDTHQSSRSVIGTRGEYGFARDTVHEDTGSSLQVIEMDEPVLGYHEDNTVFLRNLQGHGEVVGSLRGEEDVDSLLLENRVVLGVVDFNNVKFGTGGGSHGEGEELGILGSAFQPQRAEGSGVALDSLANATVLGVELHGTNNTATL
ncbi:unnamed protein product [Clonostachys chloroleuca]|uniref:Uncharacterized protein n=1 Tax=Clonostachys chloroleuca TaxID=1926264 RepID=A0AA35LWW0_9HYPO|nr:unnamed protein product [Clonostachys chloroleuca]